MGMSRRDGSSGGAYDLVVVGAGIFGLSVALEAARRGRATLVVERGTLPNPRAASFGPSRKFRTAYSEPLYAALAREALAAWREVEAQVGASLYVPAGNLYVTNLDDQPHLDQREAVARQVGARVRAFDERGMRARFPQFKRARRGLLDLDAGILRASACVEALYALALRQGVVFALERAAEAIEPSGSGLAVRVGDRTYRAQQVVLAGGGWSGQLFPELKEVLRQCQQGILYVHGVPATFEPPDFAPFVCLDNGFFGFPSEPVVGLKIAQHMLEGNTLDSPDFERCSSPAGFVEDAERFLRDDLGLRLADYPVTYDSCMYNLSPSNDFLIDGHPELPGLFFATAGSGHGFKFGPIIGKIALDRLSGLPSARWHARFSYEHFRTPAPAVVTHWAHLGI